MTTEPMRSAQGSITAEDYLHAQRLHGARMRGWLYGGGIAALLSGGVLLWTLGVAREGIMLLCGAVGGLVAHSLTWHLYVPFKVRRLHRQTKAFTHSFVYEWDDEGVRASSSQGEARRAWTDYLKYREDDRTFLLYHSDNMFEMLPNAGSPAPRRWTTCVASCGASAARSARADRFA
ncbi:YcxB family protein [Lysobacter soli]|uniref:YcxB family protein n=1 Tax=Lysobacter soli TaxID=453783 RepID=UPI0018DCD87B|nr:YcxB family protein [Lysobacter soli]